MKNKVESIPNTAQVQTVTYRPAYSTICSVGKAPFHGVMEIEFKPAALLLEFMSFDAWLHSLATEQMTIEDLARRTFDELRAVLGDIPLRVTVHAETTVHAPASATIEG